MFLTDHIYSKNCRQLETPNVLENWGSVTAWEGPWELSKVGEISVMDSSIKTKPYDCLTHTTLWHSLLSYVLKGEIEETTIKVLPEQHIQKVLDQGGKKSLIWIMAELRPPYKFQDLSQFTSPEPIEWKRAGSPSRIWVHKWKHTLSYSSS